MSIEFMLKSHFLPACLSALLFLANPTQAQTITLDTAEKESKYYTQAIKEILHETGLYMPFEGMKLRQARRMMRKMGLSQSKSYMIERSKTRYDLWEGQISLGSDIMGTATVELSGCSKGSRQLYRYAFRISDLDQTEMARLEALMNRYHNIYGQDGSGISHTVSREKFITGIAPKTGQMITAAVRLRLEEPQTSPIGQLAGDMHMQCPSGT